MLSLHLLNFYDSGNSAVQLPHFRIRQSFNGALVVVDLSFLLIICFALTLVIPVFFFDQFEFHEGV